MKRISLAHEDMVILKHGNEYETCMLLLMREFDTRMSAVVLVIRTQRKFELGSRRAFVGVPKGVTAFRVKAEMVPWEWAQRKVESGLLSRYYFDLYEDGIVSCAEMLLLQARWDHERE